MVEVFAIRIMEDRDFEAFRERLFDRLPESSQQKINTFKNLPDLQRSLLGEVIARRVLSEKTATPGKAIVFEKSEKGKPYLAGHSNPYFNISHSGNYVVLAFADEEVGIDVEKIRPINYRVAKRFYSKAEFAELDKKDGQEKLEFFFDLWTLKESYLKLLGKGLTKSLSSFTINKSGSVFSLRDGKTEIKSVFFKQYLLDTEYKLSVCSLAPNFMDEINVLNISDL
ncbi:MAG: 4'-phosphopantetheinyl transferase superfamily protein [Chlorobi bacterium]|nr:4'-phosphopantetheinyl transferase superfamily protein [Chlorobiota bacterium]